MGTPELAFIVSVFALSISAWNLYISKEKHNLEKEDRVKREGESHPVYAHKIVQGEFDGRFIPFKLSFRQVSGDPCFIEYSRIHFWFYRYLEDGTQDEVWNVWFDPFEKEWVKVGDEVIEDEYKLDLSQMIMPTRVKVRAHDLYQKDGGWRVVYDLLDISIKDFTNEVYKNDPVYKSLHS